MVPVVDLQHLSRANHQERGGKGFLLIREKKQQRRQAYFFFRAVLFCARPGQTYYYRKKRRYYGNPDHVVVHKPFLQSSLALLH